MVLDGLLIPARGECATGYFYESKRATKVRGFKLSHRYRTCWSGEFAGAEARKWLLFIPVKTITLVIPAEY
jgi:hypothetical protein